LKGRIRKAQGTGHGARRKKLRAQGTGEEAQGRRTVRGNEGTA